VSVCVCVCECTRVVFEWMSGRAGGRGVCACAWVRSDVWRRRVCTRAGTLVVCIGFLSRVAQNSHRIYSFFFLSMLVVGCVFSYACA